MGHLLRALAGMLTLERGDAARIRAGRGPARPPALPGAPEPAEGDQYDLRPGDVVVLAAARPSDAALNAHYAGACGWQRWVRSVGWAPRSRSVTNAAWLCAMLCLHRHCV